MAGRAGRELAVRARRAALAPRGARAAYRSVRRAGGRRASWSTAFWTFTGAKAAASSYAGYGPYVLIAAAALAAGATAWIVPRTLAALERGARGGPLGLVALAFLPVDLRF